MRGEAPSHPTLNPNLIPVGDCAVALMQAREYEAARPLFETALTVSDSPSVVLMIGYAVCLSELGETDRARRLHALVKTKATKKHAPLLKQAEAWLPGAKLAKDSRAAFQADAQKWLPRLPRKSA